MRRLLALLTILLILFGSVAPVRRVSAEVVAAWMEQTPVLTKDLQLSPGWPYTLGVDCDATRPRAGATGVEIPECIVQTAAGQATSSGWFLGNGIDHRPLLLDRTELSGRGGLTFVGTPSAGLLKTNVAGRVGAWTNIDENHVGTVYIGLYESFSASSIEATATYAQITGAPDTWIRDSSGARIPFIAETMAFSQDGRWLTAIMDGGNYMADGNPVVLYDTQTARVKVVATNRGSLSSGDTRLPRNLAVTNDGRFIASNIHGQTSVVYDTASCNDQYIAYTTWDYDKPEPAYCNEKVIWWGWGIPWNGEGGVSEQDPGIEVPLHLRFQDNNTVAFVGVDLTGFASAEEVQPTNVIAGRLTVGTTIHDPTGEEDLPPIDADMWARSGLLALGDSYISGEGAYNYRLGVSPVYDTDSAANKCHTSWDAHPYLLGERLNIWYASVACSGAKTEDITDSRSKYLNQLRPPQEQGDIIQQERNNILNSFIPGSFNQLQFIKRYKPKNILLSIGGNDIHFKDILVRCVLDAPTDVCFAKRPERIQLLKMIYAEHANLKDTYTKIMEASPGARLYVVGYPQIANKNGSCGLNVRMDKSELAFGEGLIDELNATIKNAAESVGARYVDIAHALDGNRLCDTTSKAMNGVTEGNDIALGTIGNESYHPTAYGHILIANKISKETDDLTQLMPAPTNAGKLEVNSNNPFITGAKEDNSVVRNLIFGNITTQAVVNKGTTMSVSTDLTAYGVSPRQNYSIGYTSEPVEVATGATAQDGRVEAEFTVPSLETGAHTLHIYTTNSEGELLDIAQVVYIAANSLDHDGDGIANQSDSCSLIQNSGRDIDGDGVDDACDGDSAGMAEQAQSTSQSNQPAVAKPASNNAFVKKNSAIMAQDLNIAASTDLYQSQNISPSQDSKSFNAAIEESKPDSERRNNSRDGGAGQPRLGNVWSVVLALAIGSVVLAYVLIRRFIKPIRK